MKKFLALMFVCAGLTAMAAAPHVNNTANITKQATHAQVMKASKAIDAQVKAKVTTQKNALTPKSFFKQYGVTPEDNMLLSKRAPKRVDDGMFGEGTHIDFRYVYTFDDEGYLTKQDPFYDGAKGVYFMLDNDTMYCAGLYWNPMGSSYYLPINLDYNNMTVELETGFGLDNKTYSGSWKYYSAQNAPVPGGQGGYYKMDTTLKTYFVNEQYFYSEEGNFDNVTGKLYSDGSIEFNDSIGYAYFGTMAVQTSYRKTQTSAASVLANDTTDIYDIFRGTQFLVPTGTHEYKYQGSNTTATTYTDKVYTYQYDDTTVVVFNLWGFGTPGNYMNIYEPSEDMAYNMYMPGQVVYDAEGRDFMNSTFELDANHGFIFDDQGYVDGFQGIGTLGDATNEYIHWDATIALDTAAGSLLYPLFDNYLRLNEGMWLLGNAQTPTIQMAPGDEVYTFSGVSEETGAEVYLFTLVLNEEGQILDYAMVTNPYQVTRTDADQVVTLGAIADGVAGKNPSDLYVAQFTVPAKETVPEFVRGDVDGNGVVDINDVTRLIDVVLGKAVEFDENAADCNVEGGNGMIDINDVTALISRVLSGAW